MKNLPLIKKSVIVHVALCNYTVRKFLRHLQILSVFVSRVLNI